MITFADIQAKCTQADIDERDLDKIAAIMSEGLTELVATEIGTGTILETLGLTVGNALLDAVYNNTDFRYVKNLLDQGRLRLDSSLVQSLIDGFSPSILTAEEATTLKNIARKPKVISQHEVALAMEGR